MREEYSAFPIIAIEENKCVTKEDHFINNVILHPQYHNIYFEVASGHYRLLTHSMCKSIKKCKINALFMNYKQSICYPDVE